MTEFWKNSIIQLFYGKNNKKWSIFMDFMNQEEKQEILERFLQYVKVDTESIPDQEAVPSSEKQKQLGLLLKTQMEEMGLSHVRMSDHGYVYGEIPSTMKRRCAVPVLGWIAHMDTSPAVSGAGVHPQIISNYDGSDFRLDQEGNYWLRMAEFPSLKRYIGQDLVVTDGHTLLGADDKAGVAEIMTMASYLMKHPELEHGEIRIGFTPDEEVGRGADFFDVKGFGADFAYTVDGGELGEIEYENFNAANAKVVIRGKSIHPGSAKGQMKNAVLIGMEFHQMLPVFENPAYTEGYEGFYHLHAMKGDVETAELEYIIRDHSMEQFLQKKERMVKIGNYLNEKYGAGSVEVSCVDSYFNMKEKILPHMHLIEHAVQALKRIGVEPKIVPIRGGTDGARLSFQGLPCPNLCTGGHNYHGRYEYIPVQSMEQCVEMLLGIVFLYANSIDTISSEEEG